MGLIEIRDASGNRAARNEYDASGRLLAVIDANGKRVEFSHDDAAQEDVITDRLGGVLRLQYDANGNVVGTEQAVTIEGSAGQCRHDDRPMTGRQRNDRASIRTAQRVNVTYSGVLPTARVVDPAGLALSSAFAYNARSDPVTRGRQRWTQLCVRLRCQWQSGELRPPRRGRRNIARRRAGLSSERRDALGTTYDLHPRWRRKRHQGGGAGCVQRALLRRMDLTYDANGNKTSETLHRTINGVSTPLKTQFGYDAANRLVGVTDPLGGVTRDGVRHGRTSDRAKIDAFGRRTIFTYDSLGLRTRTSYPDGTFETFAYDAKQQRLATDRSRRTRDGLHLRRVESQRCDHTSKRRHRRERSIPQRDGSQPPSMPTGIAPTIPTIRRDGSVGVALPPVVNGHGRTAGAAECCCGH